ncbi:MAG TPA: hypothetical protein VE868_13625 [Balneolaceae bacterium]|nr:hypothetical protein [Balneolaceae bacterium]
MSFFTQLFNADREETNGSVLLFLIFETVTIYQVILFAWKWAFYIPQLAHVVMPVGIAYYVNISFMFSGPYAILNASLITLFLLLGYFRKGRIFYILALLAMHLQYVARFSQGKVGHGSVFTGMALLCLALTTLFISNDEQRRKLTIGLFLFFMALGYTSASFCKLIASGPGWVHGSHLFLWMKERAVDAQAQNGVYHFNFVQRLLLNHKWLATMILTFGLLTELSGFMLCFRRTRWIEATLLIGMHFGVLIIMDISFMHFLVDVIILGYPWASLFDYWLRKKRDSFINSYLEEKRLTS